jgi:hypothetical protein
MHGANCQECSVLALEWGCSTSEALAIQEDLLSRTRAKQWFSITALLWLGEAQDRRRRAFELLQKHRNTHQTTPTAGHLAAQYPTDTGYPQLSVVFPHMIDGRP